MNGVPVKLFKRNFVFVCKNVFFNELNKSYEKN